MKRLLFLILILVEVTSCQEYRIRRQTMAEYENVFSKVSELEKAFAKADFKSMSGADLVSIHQTGAELYYDFNPLGLKPDQIAACEALKTRVSALKETIVARSKAEISDFKICPYNIVDGLYESSQTFPVYLLKGETLRWKVRSQKPLTVKLCNADARKVIRKDAGKTSFEGAVEIQNSSIYYLEVIPSERQYIDVCIDYKVKDMSRLTDATPIKISQAECSKDDFGAMSVTGVQMKNIFEQPRKFTLRSQLKSTFSGSSKGLVSIQLPEGTTDILYSMRIATSEQDCSSDGKFHDEMTRTYKKVKFLGLPLYEKSKSNGLFNTLLDDNRPVTEEDAYCNMYVFRSQSDARKFQDGTADASELKYDLDYSVIGSQSCNGRIPTYGASKIYLGFENVRVRYTNYLWVEVLAAVPMMECYRTVYSIE